MPPLTKEALETIMRAVPVAIVILEKPDGKVAYINDYAKKLYGGDFLDLANTSQLNLKYFKPDGSPYPLKDIPSRRALVNGHTVLSEEVMIERPDGSRIYVSISAVPFTDVNGANIGSITIFENVTERKKTEEAFRESEERFRVTANGTPSMLWVSNTDAKSIFVNKYYEEFFKVTLEQAREKWQPLVHPEDKPLYVGKFLEAVNQHKQFSAQARVRRGDGEWRWIESYAAPRFALSGEFLGHVGISLDITERKKAEDALTESEERFSKAFYANPTAMAISRIDGLIVDVNFGFEKLLGLTRDEVIGKQGRDLGLYAALSERQELVRNLKEKRNLSDYEIILRHKSGKPITAIFTLERINLKGEPHFLGTAIDITERRKLQEKLEEYTKNLEALVSDRTRALKNSERLAAIGATAGMVGHDIRNPLQAITGDLYLAKEELKGMPNNEAKQAIWDSLNAIEDNIFYINKIVSDLQDYTRPLKPKYEEVNLKDLINSTLTKANVPDNIQIEMKLKANLSLKVDGAYLTRALVNLVINAVQAMPKGGKLTITGVFADDRAVISVEDTGVGIPEEVKPNLFMPLFTTKSKGQGLGLAVVKHFVEGLNGKISFESKEGSGTKFVIELPFENKEGEQRLTD